MNEIDLVIEFEGLRLQKYEDVAGKWTIGYGHLIKPGEDFDVISIEFARELLDNDLKEARRCVRQNVKVPLSVNQNSALVSLVYNIGCGAFSTSTLLRELNAGNYRIAADNFLRWNKARIKDENGQSILRSVPGLTNRRMREREIFLL